MKKGDEGMTVWSAILVPAILSGFGVGFEGGGEGIAWSLNRMFGCMELFWHLF